MSQKAKSRSASSLFDDIAGLAPSVTSPSPEPEAKTPKPQADLSQLIGNAELGSPKKARKADGVKCRPVTVSIPTDLLEDVRMGMTRNNWKPGYTRSHDFSPIVAELLSLYHQVGCPHVYGINASVAPLLEDLVQPPDPRILHLLLEAWVKGGRPGMRKIPKLHLVSDEKLNAMVEERLEKKLAKMESKHDDDSQA